MGIFDRKRQQSGEAYFRIGLKFYEKKEYKKALIIFENVAKYFNIPEAELIIGQMYDYGLGKDVNYEQAMTWYRKAVNKGHKTAQNSIGVLYLKGRGVGVDYEEAMRWFEIASDNGFHDAHLNMGLIYQFGYGVNINQEQAFRYYQMAADLCNNKAQYKVGNAYRNGLGATKNVKKALEWIIKSAKNSYDLAQLQLRIDYMNGFGVNKSFEKAIKWFTKSGHLPKSKLCIGYMYENGLGVDRNEMKAKQYFDENGDFMFDLGMIYFKMNEGKEGSEQALYWFEKAAERKNVQALAVIGSMYLTGMLKGGRDLGKAYGYLSQAANIEQVPLAMNQLMCSQDRVVHAEKGNAMKWYFKTSNDGRSIVKDNISGLSCLGYLYHKGIGVRQDFLKAHEMYINVLQEIDYDDSDANMCLGLLYSQGSGVDQDHEEAMKYFQMSAKKVNTYTYNNIGDAYKFGNGVQRDDQKAIEWYMKGSKYNDGYSQLNIGKLYFDIVAPSWFLKSYNSGCKEARKYIQLAKFGDYASTSSSLAAARVARKATEDKVCQLRAALARVDPKNEILMKITAEDSTTPSISAQFMKGMTIRGSYQSFSS